MLEKAFRALIVTAFIVGLAACKSLPDQYATNSSISQSQLIDGVAFLGLPIEDADLPEADILAITPEMNQFLDEHIRGLNGYGSKAREILRSLFEKDKFGLTYDPRATYTASQTFENKVGNCLAFSFLYSALAKEVGLNVNFQEVEVLPQWDYANDEIYVENGHVNVRVNMVGGNALIVDIDQVEPERNLNYTILDSDHIQALYYGNVAVELFLKQKNEEAFKYFVRAIKTKKDIPSLWANLGVLYRRTGNPEYAEKAYFTALEYDNRNSATLNNLAFMYDELGDTERSEYYNSLVTSYQNNNPYFRYVKAKKAVDEREYEEALKHINYAIKKKEEEARFYKLKSEIHAVLGESRKASKALRTAQEMEAETP
jgi:Flp pilus assembly protein TadD